MWGVQANSSLRGVEELLEKKIWRKPEDTPEKGQNERNELQKICKRRNFSPLTQLASKF